jgi:flavin-dependent dehydrogenase
VVDFLIIGGGVAGSALAILLGRQGRSVELFERELFPREKPCGEGLMPSGVAVLEKLGLGPAVGGLRFDGIRYHRAGRSVEARFPKVAGLPDYGLAQRRYWLDQVLFEAAASTPGVRVSAGCALDQLVRCDGRIRGAVIGGNTHRAKIVVGADGANSRTRALLGWNVAANRKRVGARAHFRLAAGRDAQSLVNVYLLDDCELYVTPLPDGEVGVAALADGDSVGMPLDAAFREWRSRPRQLAEYLEGAEQTTDLMATSPLGNGSRRGSAPGVVLLGDAGGSTDPITGGGMAQALLSAALLARHLCRNECADSGWLAAFERDRRLLLRDYRRVTRMVLWLSRHPRAAHVGFDVVKRFPSMLSHLIGVSGGLRSLLGMRGATQALLPEMLRDAPEGAPAARVLPEFQR